MNTVSDEMERNKLMFEAFSYHGSNAFTAYLQHRNETISTDELKKIIIRCLPRHSNEKLQPMQTKFANFLGKQAHFLYLPKEIEQSQPFKSNSEDLFPATPPIELYLKYHWDLRLFLYLRTLQLYDIVVGKVTARTSLFYLVDILCFASSKCRQIDDLFQKAVLFCEEDIKIGSLIRGSVTGSNGRERHVRVSIDINDLPPQYRTESLKLGVITEEELPLHYKLSEAKNVPPYMSFIKPNLFHKPDYYANMMKFFASNSLDLPSYTTYMANSEFHREHCASYIQAQQMLELSNFKYQQGMEFYIHNDNDTAFRCFNESLKLNPKNLDSLLNLGAMLMYSQKYTDAIKSFEKVLVIKKTHEKAKQFLCTCLQKKVMSIPASDYEQIFEYSKKLLKYDFKASKNSLLRVIFKTAYLDKLGPVWFHFHKSDQREQESKSSGSDMDVEETDENKIEVEHPVEPDIVENKVPTDATLVSGTEAISSSVTEKEKTAAKSANDDGKWAQTVTSDSHKLKCNEFINSNINKTNLSGTSGSRLLSEVGQKLEPSLNTTPDAHKLKCDEFINSMSKKSVIGPDSDRSPKKEKWSKRHRSHSRHHHHHHHHSKKKHRHRRLSKSSTRHKDKMVESDDFTGNSSSSDACESYRDSYKPAKLVPKTKSYFEHDIRRRSDSFDYSRSRSRDRRARSPDRFMSSRDRRSRSRSPHKRGKSLLREHSRSPEPGTRSRSNSRHSNSHSPVRQIRSPSTDRRVRSRSRHRLTSRSPEYSGGFSSPSTSHLPQYPFPPLSRVPINTVSGASYSIITKEPAVKILNDILDKIEKPNSPKQ